MDIKDLATQFQDTRELQMKAIFSSIFITGNRLQTFFDNNASDISLKQFMLLTIIKQNPKAMTFTQLGKILGCSRQNIKKIAEVLCRKEYITLEDNPADARVALMKPTQKMHDYFTAIEGYHQEQLTVLFSKYSDEELIQFFRLIMKLYEGIDELDKTHHE